MSNLLEQLQHPDPTKRTQAVKASAQTEATFALLVMLEYLAARDPDETVQAMALEALDQPGFRSLRSSRLANLPISDRNVILQELETWQKRGLIGDAHAKALRSRYWIKPQPAPVPAAQTAPQTQPAPTTTSPTEPTSTTPAAPRPTLAQTLLSETSIKTFLYLGAFFVISAAIILAALVETLRLPMLIVVTAAFGGAALRLKIRLPQPSFVLFIVFSALLPINAGVIADLADFRGQVLSAFWVFSWLAICIFWIFAAWFYNSRFFSMVSLGAFVAVSNAIPGTISAQPAAEFTLLTTQLGNLATLAAIWLLIRHKGQQFAVPAFMLAQVFSAFIVMFEIFNTGINLYSLVTSESATSGIWISMATTWIFISLFYISSQLLIPFPLFPFFGTAALAPILYLLLNAINLDQQIIAIGWTIWAGLFAVASDVVRTIHPKTREYNLPLSLASIALFLIGGIWGLVQSTAWGFALFASAAITLSIIHVLQPRGWIWLSALFYGAMAYFLFFNLPFLPDLSEYTLYQLSGATLLLLLPDLFLKPEWSANPSWRYPLRGFGILIGLLTFTITLISVIGDTKQASICAFSMGGFFLLYAVRYKNPFLGYLFTVHFILGLTYFLNTIHSPNTFPILSILAFVYYAIGFVLHRIQRESWSETLRWSALGLALLLSLSTFMIENSLEGWYVALFALMFMIETSAYPLLEIIAPILFSLGFGLVFVENRIQGIPYLLAGITILWLATDAAYQRGLKLRPLRWVTRTITGMIGLATTVELLTFRLEYINCVEISIVLSIFILAHALLYRQPRLGYAFTAFLALTALFVSRLWGENTWTGVLIALAIFYYITGFAIKKEWGSVLRFSGLGLGTLVSISIPFADMGIAASIPITLGATLWAVEAFRCRNVWLGFPANGLYLLAYFILLISLEISQPQFYSIGAALLGMLMHYLLMRAGSDFGAFITGTVSQLILIGTTYIQMIALEQLGFFAALFFQALIVLIYGLIVRSRSLVGIPIAMLILGVTTIVFFILRGLSTVILIGCTGILMIVLATMAVVLRERLVSMGERLSGWKA